MNLDDLLHDDGLSWRASVDKTLTDTAADFESNPKAVPANRSEPRGRHALPAVAAAVVVAALVVIGVLAGHHTNPASPTAKASTSASTTNARTSTVSTTLPTQPATTDTISRTIVSNNPPVSAATRLPGPAVDAAAISVPWLYVSTSADDRTLTVQYIAGEGTCLSHRGFVVDESTTSIELTVVDERDLSQTSCANDLLELQATITLATPIGHRALIHAPVASTWQNFQW